MINVLPEKEKRILKHGLKIRFAITLSFMIVFSLIISIIFLVPAFVMAKIKLAETISKNEILERSPKDEQAIKLLDLPEEIKSKLQIFEANMTRNSITEVFYQVFSDVPEGIKINSIFFSGTPSSAKKTSKEISLSGLALTRKDLLDFSGELKNLKFVSEVDVPVSNFTKENNIPFSIKVFVSE